MSAMLQREYDIVAIIGQRGGAVRKNRGGARDRFAQEVERVLGERQPGRREGGKKRIRSEAGNVSHRLIYT